MVEGLSVLGFIKSYAWGPLMALIGWGWADIQNRFESLKSHVDKQDEALKVYIDKEHTDLKSEVNRQRDVSAKIFDKLEDMTKRSEDRHVELLNIFHQGLAGKADK